MQSEWFGGSEGSKKEPEEDDDEAPETPLDEPRPPRVQDPPPEPDSKHPYVVRTTTGRPQAARGRVLGDRAPEGRGPRAEGTARIRKTREIKQN